MGIFRRSFGGAPDRKDWSAISLSIAQGLEGLRKQFFAFCVDSIKDSLPEEDEHSQEVEVKNTSLGGEAELAIKAYQLYLTSLFLGEHEYISPKDVRDFADLLYAQVSGTQLEQCLDYLSRYTEPEIDGGTQLFRFSSDVAKYITASEAPLIEAMAISSAFGTFVALHHMLVAEIFGDEKTVKRMRKVIREKE